MGGFSLARKLVPKAVAMNTVKPVAPSPTKAEVSQVTATSAVDMKKSKGRSSTILTGAKGLGDNALTTSKKSLLGG
tara:strand:- start:249 stop:476 length:228 start_codon:yes stop_codon:yes gene_type:complete